MPEVKPTALLLLSLVCVARAELRLGIIGTDTSHVIAFTRILNDETLPDHVPGARVVAAYKGGSPDVKDSAGRVDKFAEELRAKLEPFATVFLRPMFFTFSGLNTQLQVVDNLALLGAALAILAASILAKGGACYLAARLSGHDHATAMGIGALMNARGLMELIIINIGLQRGIIEPGLFAILVVMAIVTTLMASPLFEAVYGRRTRAEGRV